MKLDIEAELAALYDSPLPPFPKPVDHWQCVADEALTRLKRIGELAKGCKYIGLNDWNAWREILRLCGVEK